MKKKSDLIVFASARAKPGKEKDLERALRNVAGPTRSQPGSVAFSLYRSQENPAMILALERWGSKTEHERHLQGTHVQKLMSAMADILAEPPQISSFDILDEE